MSGLCLCLYSGITYRWVFVLRILFRQIYIILFLSCIIVESPLIVWDDVDSNVIELLKVSDRFYVFVFLLSCVT